MCVAAVERLCLTGRHGAARACGNSLVGASDAARKIKPSKLQSEAKAGDVVAIRLHTEIAIRYATETRVVAPTASTVHSE